MFSSSGFVMSRSFLVLNVQQACLIRALELSCGPILSAHSGNFQEHAQCVSSSYLHCP